MRAVLVRLRQRELRARRVERAGGGAHLVLHLHHLRRRDREQRIAALHLVAELDEYPSHAA